MKIMEKTSRSNYMIKIVMITILIQAAYVLLIMMTGVRYVLPYAAGISAAFIIPKLADLYSRKIGLAASCVMLAGAAVILVILHSEIFDGMQLVMNSLFEASEKTQAYLYDKYEVIRDPGTFIQCMRYAVLWTGIAAGTAMSFLSLKIMRWVSGLVFILCAGCFAYFGLLPQAIPAMIMIVALAAVLSESRLTAVLPVMIAGMMVFALILAVAPGENKAVSKADENLRDKLATRTVSIQGNEKSEAQQENEKQTEEENGANGQSLFGGGTKSMKGWIVLGLILLFAMILFIPAVIHDRLEKRRKKNRMDIDSKDPKTAVRAMFPYAVKWLKEAGLKTGNVPFADLTEGVRELSSEEYALEYSDMLVKWKLAAYSDHDLGEDERCEMKAFLEKTIADVREKMSFADKIRVRFVTAL